MSLSFDHTTLPQRVVFASGGAARNIAAQVELLGAERILLIAGRTSSPLAETVALDVPVVARIDRVRQHVPIGHAEAATALAMDVAADAIVAIGGGSATGLAKIVAIRTGLPIVSVPTTFAGSEATDVWGLTEGGRKVTGADPLALPAVIVYDATLTAGLPTRLAIASGLNAVAHAVDAFWAPRADPVNRALGTEGLTALVAGLHGMRASADDLGARERTLYGAYLAAVAFASAGSGIHHKICHVLGGRFGLSHAEMHAVVLPHVAAFLVPAAPDAAARISAAFGGAPAHLALFRFSEQLDAPRSLRELGLREADLPEAARLALEAVPPSTPRPVSLADMRQLLTAAWAGTPTPEGRP